MHEDELNELDVNPQDDLGAIQADDLGDAASVMRSETSAYERDAFEENLTGIKQDRVERKKYAARIFVMVCIWLGAVILTLMFQGFLGPRGCFLLPDSVLIATVTSTTASIVAIFAFVAKYLFPKR